MSLKWMMISARVDEEVYDKVATHAHECGMTISEFARYAMLKECRCGRDEGE